MNRFDKDYPSKQKMDEIIQRIKEKAERKAKDEEYLRSWRNVPEEEDKPKPRKSDAQFHSPIRPKIIREK